PMPISRSMNVFWPKTSLLASTRKATWKKARPLAPDNMTEGAPGQHSSAPPRSWEHIPDVFGRVEDISASLVMREGQQFLLTDERGMVPASVADGGGLYYNDTRHLSVY